MRIVLFSYHFHPSIGGLETSSRFLANGLTERGHDVTVVTATPDDGSKFPFPVVRRPGPLRLLRLVRDADVVWQNQISMRSLWPLFLIPRPLIIMHHIWLRARPGAEPRFGWLKRLACRMGQNVFVSKELQQEIGLPGTIVPNSYDDETFRLRPDIERDRDVAFLGRLVRYKGADLLIDAVARLAARGIQTKTTVIGQGPEATALKQQAANAGVGSLVDFAGPQRGEPLARLLNRHKILVIPSRYDEAFGIVALEALACGCVVVAADSGALQEVVGPCGATFPKEDASALTDLLEKLLSDRAIIDEFRRQIPAHLARFDKTAVLDACEAVIRETAEASTANMFRFARS